MPNDSEGREESAERHQGDAGGLYERLTGRSDSQSPVLTVGELTRQIRRLLETNIGAVAVEGEISNWRAAASGHAYFMLKDADASIRCVMFRSAVARLRFQPADGQKVEARGRLSVYEVRGEYQVVVEMLSEQGLGALFEAFVRLKEKLEREGLFDPAHKKSLPFLPKRIGIVTSPTGAAVRDILNVLGRRFANLHVYIWPVRVQGEGAAQEIAHALTRLDRLDLVDVIICGRGGGSIEDLWAFNEEVVARAIFRSRTPVISAVGHEIDFTIADFVADLRAPTPSAAAELVVTNQLELLDRIRTAHRRLDQAVLTRLKYMRSKVDGLLRSHALEQPRFLLEQVQQRCDDLMARIEAQAIHVRRLTYQRLGDLDGRLAVGARAGMRAASVGLSEQGRRLERASKEHAARIRQRVEVLCENLALLGPEATFARGYSLVLRRRSGETVRSPRQVSLNDPLDIHTEGGVFPALATPPPRVRQSDWIEDLDCGD